MALSGVQTRQRIYYPSSDGQPVAESDFQLHPLLYAVTTLRTYFLSYTEIEQARQAAEQARQAAEAERARQEQAAAQARQGEWSTSARSTDTPGKTPATQFLQQNDHPTGRRALREVGTSTGRRRRAEPEQGESRTRSAVNPPTGSHARPDPEESSHHVDPTPSGRHSRG